jgi:hypothetical protein
MNRIEIKSSKKVLVKQLEDIANQIALLIYGKKLRQCLGHPSRFCLQRSKIQKSIFGAP